jgi:teichoic acid transport system ATP-binding protein
MADRKPARLAAPLALLVVAVAVAVVVQASGPDSSHSTQTTTRTALTQPTRRARAPPRTYVVKPGDTLTTIAEQAGVTLDAIQRLNPEVDPNALQTGQRLKLSP